MYLSDIFRFTQKFGQKGHQIGRKVGDAVELLTMGMVYKCEELSKHLVIEDGLEGATSAKHKVEFAFYNIEAEKPSKRIADLFGFIECKKVGVETTIKQNFKAWLKNQANRNKFHLTNGYAFSIKPRGGEFSWTLKFTSAEETPKQIDILLNKMDNNGNLIQTTNESFEVSKGSNIMVSLDINNVLHILGPESSLHELEHSIDKCIILSILEMEEDGINSIIVNECLTGPQTPEKAKQASFVSLDVRKKVLGRFDKDVADTKLISILVIGEASHWDTKSKAMIRLCNDYNLMIPDKVIIRLFELFLEEFGDDYQDSITKTAYKRKELVREKVDQVLKEFNYEILQDMDSNIFYEFDLKNIEGRNTLALKNLQH